MTNYIQINKIARIPQNTNTETQIKHIQYENTNETKRPYLGQAQKRRQYIKQSCNQSQLGKIKSYNH